jgi:hypothetical protein
VQTTLAVVLVAFFMLTAVLSACAQTGDVAVVVNEKNRVDNLSGAELRKICSGERHSWPGGLPIKLFVRATGAREREVVLKLLGMSEGEYRQYWTAQVFRGDAQAEPMSLPSNGMQKEAIMLYPGALALVVIEDVRAGMKVVRVDGHMPGEPGYPIK